MQALLTDQWRLLALVGLCGLLWSLESIVPLYRYQNGRVRHALPNVALAVMLVLTNLALSFSSAYLAGFTVRNGLGLFPLGMPLWTQVVLGVLALDLFGYFAHVLLHKSWLGWQFHRVHHYQRETDSNYANLFSFWDRLFGTYTAEIDFRKLRYGLDGFDTKDRQTLRGLLKMPLVSYTRS